MATLLIVLAVLAVAALAVTFGFRRANRTDEPPARVTTVDTVAEVGPTDDTERAAVDVADDNEVAGVVDAPVADVVEAPVADESEVSAEPIVKPRLRERLGRTRATLAGYVKGIAGRGIDQSTWDDLEEALLLADVGLDTTTALLDAVRARVKEFKITDADEVVALLRAEIEGLLERAPDRALGRNDDALTVWMFVGVNGVGKTTTIGKLAAQQIAEGRSVVLAAGDTFRAAAAEQLTQWADRTGAEIVRGQEGADPGSVVFDGVSAAQGRGADMLLVDTAGRLHNKANLMAELEKLKRIVERSEGALREVLLVIDATTGQNGLQQAKQFAEVVDVSGIVLTKLDGSAKGGIVLAIQAELGLPVKLVGVGEQVGDLIDFDPSEFAAALFDE